MSTESKVSQYLLLMKGEQWDKGLSPEELQKAMDQFMGWFEQMNQLKEQGKFKGGQPLERDGRVVSARNGGPVSDGPYAESKEAIGGYILLELDSFEEALAFAKACPVLKYGATIEVRPVAEECPTFQRVKDQLAHAMA